MTRVHVAYDPSWGRSRALTLFDFTNGTVTPPGPLMLQGKPSARTTDPVTSHLAAEKVKPAGKELVAAIRWWVGKQREPKTAFQIADAIYGQRWSHATVRTAVSKAGLHEFDEEGVSPRKQACIRYVLEAS